MSEDVAARLVKVMRNNNPDFVYETLAGGHHVHMDSPDEVAAIINNFLGRPFDNSGSEEKENMKASTKKMPITRTFITNHNTPLAALNMLLPRKRRKKGNNEV